MHLLQNQTTSVTSKLRIVSKFHDAPFLVRAAWSLRTNKSKRDYWKHSLATLAVPKLVQMRSKTKIEKTAIMFKHKHKLICLQFSVWKYVNADTYQYWVVFSICRVQWKCKYPRILSLQHPSICPIWIKICLLVAQRNHRSLQSNQRQTRSLRCLDSTTRVKWTLLLML